jgi:hypothetical protein
MAVFGFTAAGRWRSGIAFASAQPIFRWYLNRSYHPGSATGRALAGRARSVELHAEPVGEIIIGIDPAPISTG